MSDGGAPPQPWEAPRRLFEARLRKRAHHLRRWPARLGITCYRLYDHDVPEVPLAVDVYEDHLHIAEYASGARRSPAEQEAWLEAMVTVAAAVLGVPRERVHLKRRTRQLGLSQYERQGSGGRLFPVREGGLRFLVNLDDYLDTGLFLDHRHTRAMVRERASGKRFLNLFSYTGSFTVYAAAGGAVTTTTVDLSRTYLDWAEENLRVNALEGASHRLVRADAMAFISEHAPGPAYDLAVVDPPTFSNSKRMEGIWDIQRHHASLLNRLLALMAPGGLAYFSTNFRRFQLEREALAWPEVREISNQTVPQDFTDRKVHRTWLLRAGQAPGSDDPARPNGREAAETS